MKPYLSGGLLIAGIVLLIWGLQSSESFSSEVSRAFTGAPTDRAIWLTVAGIVLTVAGLFGFIGRGGGRKMTT
jgi:hypothetical protein